MLLCNKKLRQTCCLLHETLFGEITMPLPIVQKEIIDSLLHRFNGVNDRDIIEMIKKVEERDRMVGGLIRRALSTDSHAALDMLMLYSALESHEEADDLKTTIGTKLDPPAS